MRFPLLDSFLTILWFFLWILWLILLIRVVADVFRSGDLSGWAKAAWLAFILVLPFVGVLIYLIARGTSMQERRIGEAHAQEDQFRAYLRDTAGVRGWDGADGAGGAASQLAKLADLRDKGILSEAEFQQGKAKILA